MLLAGLGDRERRVELLFFMFAEWNHIAKRQPFCSFVLFSPVVLFVGRSSGALLPPYVFNGFLAQLTFREMDGQPPQLHSRGTHLKNQLNPHQPEGIPSIKKNKNFLFIFLSFLKNE